MSLHSLPALAAESLEESSTAGAPSVPSKSMSIVAGYSCSAKMMESLSHSQSGRTLPNSTGDLGLDAWILSLADSRARTSARQDAAPVLPENAQDSGPKWHALLAKYNHDTSSWKTPQCSLFEDSEPSLEIWPRWGSMRNGVAYRRQKPAHLISGTGYGLWPTPTVCGNHNRKGASKTSGDGLATAVDGFLKATELPDLDALNAANSIRMWPTPQTRFATNDGDLSLLAKTCKDWDEFNQMAYRASAKKKAMYWQTPVADDAVDRKRGKFNSRGEPKLSAEVLQLSGHGQQTPPMMLNPEWVEWLMGWPLGWTDLKPLGMDRFQEWLRQHGKR